MNMNKDIWPLRHQGTTDHKSTVELSVFVSLWQRNESMKEKTCSH